MGLTSNTGLLAVPQRYKLPEKEKEQIELRCDVTAAPFMLRPYAGLYNPFSHNCSVLCNHPAETETKTYVKKAKDAWAHDGKGHDFNEDLSKFHEYGGDKEKNRTPHDIVTEDMFRRYTETDSRPHTPALTLASGKSRGSRRCLTPDEPHQRTAIVVDLRRSHSQETIYYHGYPTSDVTGDHGTSATVERSTLPSVTVSEGGKDRLGKVQCEQLPPLASPLVLSKRNLPPKEAAALKIARKNQLKGLNLGKVSKGKKNDSGLKEPKEDKNVNNDGAETGLNDMDEDEGESGGEIRRRGKRRRKGRPVGSDRLTSAGLAAQSQQDPETQIAGIGSDSHNPSTRGSVVDASEANNVVPLPTVPRVTPKKTDSFLDHDILKYLHRDVDEDAIHSEFDIKRRYVLVEAYRTRPSRNFCAEMQSLLKEIKVPPMSLGDWLHIPRVFSRQNAHFSLPLDSNALQGSTIPYTIVKYLTPMQYAARFVILMKSKQLLYLTVLRKFNPGGYRLPIDKISEGLILMMGGILSPEQVSQFRVIMEWESYQEEEADPDDIKLTIAENVTTKGDEEAEANTLKFRTWCGLCAICERMYGRFPPRERDPPRGIELSDFTLLETKLPVLKVHIGLVEILNAIRSR